MKKRKIILITLDLVLLAVLIVQIAVSSVDPRKTFLLSEKPDEVHIYNSGKQIDLYSSDNGETWVIGEHKYPANSVFVQDLIEKFSKLNAINKVGSVKNEASIDRFGLNEFACISVSAKKGGNVIRSLQIGKSPAGVQQVYATVDGEKDIYLIEGNLRNSFDYEEDYLRDKRIYEIPAESIKSVEYTDENGKVFQVPEDKIASYAYFTTDTFVIPEDLSQAKKKYSVTINADKTITMEIYELLKSENEYTYIGICSESPYKFSVPSYAIEKFAAKTEETDKK